MNHVLKPGEKLPDIKQLCAQFNVSHITIQTALANLHREGFIIRIKSKGTFVQEQAKEVKGTMAMVISVIERNDTTLLNVIKGAQNEAAKKGFTFLLEITDGFEESEKLAIANFIQRGVSGLLLYMNHEELAYRILREYSGENGLEIPYVMIDHYETSRPSNSVTPNNLDGGFMATEHLIRKGHRSIAFISSNIKRNTEYDRYLGYRCAMEAYGFEQACRMLEYSPDAMKVLLSSIRAGEVTAAFAVNDRMALMALHYLYENQIRVPEDFSLIGFDDSYEANYAIVPLTTVRQDFFEIGAQAVKLLRDVLVDIERGAKYKKVFLPVQVVERNSVKKINH